MYAKRFGAAVAAATGYVFAALSMRNVYLFGKSALAGWDMLTIFGKILSIIAFVFLCLIFVMLAAFSDEFLIVSEGGKSNFIRWLGWHASDFFGVVGDEIRNRTNNDENITLSERLFEDAQEEGDYYDKEEGYYDWDDYDDDYAGGHSDSGSGKECYSREDY